MTDIALQHYLAVGGIMFAIGLIGFMCRRNLIVMFLCTELMFQGVAINLIAFGAYHGDRGGQAFVIFVLVIAAAEASLALGLVVLLFRQRRTLDASSRQAVGQIAVEKPHPIEINSVLVDPDDLDDYATADGAVLGEQGVIDYRKSIVRRRIAFGCGAPEGCTYTTYPV